MASLDWVALEAMPSLDLLFSKYSRLRDGDLAGAKAKYETVLMCGLELHSREIVGSAKGCSVVDLPRAYYLDPDFLPFFDSDLRFVNAIQASLNDWLEGGRPRLAYSIWKSCNEEDRWYGATEESSAASNPSYAVVVSAVVLLSLVYQYLTGNVDIGSPKAYSRSSLDFRDIYVAVVLFLGAYVWIKFREVALRGVHPRKRVDKQCRTKVVYDARLTPPMWNGEAVPKLDLGQFATPQEAHNKFLIAAFYYNRDAGLLDGWFQVPSMSEEERSLTGLELRAWVIGQAKKAYEDFKKEKAEAALLLQELFEAWENEETPEQDEVNVKFSIASLLNPDEHQQPALVSRVENVGMDMAMLDDQGLECASHSFVGMHEGLALSSDHRLGFEEGFALPVSQLPPNTESGMSLNGSDQCDLPQTLTSDASLLNSAKLPLLVSPAENSGMAIAMLDDEGLECASQSFDGMHEGFVTSNGHSLGFQKESAIPISQLTPDTQSGMGINNSNQLNLLQTVQNQQQLITYLRQQLEESRIHISQLESQHFVQQQLQVMNEGVPSLEVEHRMPHQNHPCGPTAASAFW